jgi:hypothetical protein
LPKVLIRTKSEGGTPNRVCPGGRPSNRSSRANLGGMDSMKCKLETLSRWFLSGLILLSAASPALGWDLFEPISFQDPQVWREPTEIERMLIIRGQPPRQPLDVSIRQPLDPGRPTLRPQLDPVPWRETPVGASTTGSEATRMAAPIEVGQVLQQSSSVQSTNGSPSIRRGSGSLRSRLLDGPDL